MPAHHSRGVAVGFACAIALLLNVAHADERRRPNPPSEFEFVTINVEQNATDGDTEVVISAKAGDEGLHTLSIRTPEGRHVAHVLSLDRSVMGLREFVFESPEPEGEAILAAYPEGTYTFTGVSSIGERFRGEAVLTHVLPAATTILHPAQDAEVGFDSLIIEWSAVPGIREYVLEFENESVDPQQTLRVNLPPSQTSFVIPTTMLVQGAAYQVGVWTVSSSGNISVTETTFSTRSD
jgi:hypothetical protein